MPDLKEVEFEGTFDNVRDCVRVQGDGSARITFNTDSTQLAKVLLSFAYFNNKVLKIKVFCGRDKQKKGKKEPEDLR